MGTRSFNLWMSVYSSGQKLQQSLTPDNRGSGLSNKPTGLTRSMSAGQVSYLKSHTSQHMATSPMGLVRQNSSEPVSAFFLTHQQQRSSKRLLTRKEIIPQKYQTAVFVFDLKQFTLVCDFNIAFPPFSHTCW